MKLGLETHFCRIAAYRIVSSALMCAVSPDYCICISCVKREVAYIFCSLVDYQFVGD